MIKHCIIFSAAALLLLTTTENQSWVQGFAGFHGAPGAMSSLAGDPTMVYTAAMGITERPVSAMESATGTWAIPTRPSEGQPTSAECASAAAMAGEVQASHVGLPRDQSESTLLVPKIRGQICELVVLDALNESLSQMNLPSDAGIPAAGSKSEKRD